MRLLAFTILALVANGLGTPSADAATLYVNAVAAGPGTGASWATAFPSLQQGLAAAGSGDEVWVAGGVYHPAARPTFPTEGRQASFVLKAGVAIYGGFAGSETSKDQRDFAAH